MGDIVFIDLLKNDYKLKKTIFRDKKVIALSANSMWCLNKNNISYKTPYDYYDYKILDNQNNDDYNKAKITCRKINIIFKKNNLLPTYASSNFLLHPIKTLLSDVNHRKKNIQYVIDTEVPKNIIYFTDKSIKSKKIDIYEDPDLFGYYEKIINYCASKADSTFIKIKKNNHLLFFNTIKLKIIYFKTYIKELLDYFLNIVNAINEKTNLSTYNIFIGQNSQSVRCFYNQLDKKKYKLLIKNHRFSMIYNFFIFYRLFRYKNFNKLINKIISDTDLIKQLEFDSNLYNSLIKKPLTKIIKVSFKQYISSNYQSIRLLKKNRIDIFISSTITNSESWAQRDFCAQNHIPVITWQHGSYCMFENFVQPIYYDLEPADYFFAFGIGVKNHFVSKGINQGKIINIGSPHLDILVGKQKLINKNPEIPNYVVPIRAIDVSKYVDSYQKYPQGLYWQELQKLIDALSSLNNYNFTLKLYPYHSYSNNPIEDYIKYCNYNNIYINNSKSFTEVLVKSSGCIIDWPYTTLLESLALNKKTIIYQKNWTFSKSIDEMISSNCILVNNLNDLCNTIKNIQKVYNHNNYERLLMDYGIHKNDMDSINRGEKIINEIINQT
tara:strand:+ start:53 stop:1879 length:1827 start_codon:yes stop_codon:yes gene_type:complete